MKEFIYGVLSGAGFVILWVLTAPWISFAYTAYSDWISAIFHKAGFLP